jgi:MHS family proline/betaine transporter-like MFS transporter
MTDQTTHEAFPAMSKTERRRTIIAASAGNFAEWYDWGVYGIVATVIAKRLFPANEDATIALLSAYAVFAISYLTRPFGGVIFGHIADKLGRKRALSLTIIVTCVSTGLIGLIPDYSVIGWLAPILLLAFRLVQAIGTGGEYSTAISFVYEHGQKGKKASSVGVLTALTFVGFLVGSLFATILSAVMTETAFDDWGWRILFLLALPMGTIGLYLRRKTEEGAEFKELQKVQDNRVVATKSPLTVAFRLYWRRILIFAAFLGTWAIISATMTNYLATFLKSNAALSLTQVNAANALSSIMIVVFVLVFSPIADRIGLRRAMIVGALLVIFGTIPGFILAGDGVFGGFAGAALLGICKGVLAVPSLLAISQIFPAKIRVTAGGLSYNLAQSILGGTAPFIAVWLNSVTDNSLFFSSYLVLAGIVTLVITLVCAKGWIAESASHSGDIANANAEEPTVESGRKVAA